MQLISKNTRWISKSRRKTIEKLVSMKDVYRTQMSSVSQYDIQVILSCHWTRTQETAVRLLRDLAMYFCLKAVLENCRAHQVALALGKYLPKYPEVDGPPKGSSPWVIVFYASLFTFSSNTCSRLTELLRKDQVRTSLICYPHDTITF